MTMALALLTIHSKGLWKDSEEFESFDDYGKKRLGLEKTQIYRLLKYGRGVHKMLNSPYAHSLKDKLPINEIQFRTFSALPESHWEKFWYGVTAYRDPAYMTRSDIEEELRVYMKRENIKSEKSTGRPTTKVGRVLSKFKDLKDELSKLKGLDRLDPRIQDLVELLEQGPQGVSNPDETSPEEFNSAVQQGTELLVAREQGGSPFDWEAILPGAQDDAESEKPEEVTA